MAGKTRINPELRASKVTEINDSIAEGIIPSAGTVTEVNPHIPQREQLSHGTVLCEKYRIEEKMTVTTGEADLYICTYDKMRYVAKVYRRTASVKTEVMEKLRQIHSPYVAQVVEMGEYQGAVVEILPYYNRGSLSGKTFSYEQLRNYIIPCLNEGLHALHEANIIHKDLKPSNIMVQDDQESVSIIDFGISSVTETGNTVIVTKTGMTPEYAAPETFKGLYSSNADYYSLGITLYALFGGSTPYGNMSTEEIEKYIALQRIPFPETMPTELQELIRALTYYDISNRRDKSNPNRRWGYEEVKKWLEGEKQTIPGEGIDRKIIKPYSFAGEEYTSRTNLVRALVERWDEGKKELFRGKLSDHYKLEDPEAFRICQEAEHEAIRVSGKDDHIFWKAMYALQPQTRDFFWKGKVYLGLAALGRELLESLRENKEAMDAYMDGILSDGLLSEYITMKDPGQEEMLAAVKGLEASYHVGHSNPRDRKVVLYLTAYMLSNQKILYVAEERFHTLEELTGYMKAILGNNNEHLDQFNTFCHSLMDQYDNLIPAFESWLIALGKREALECWKEEMHAYAQ